MAYRLETKTQKGQDKLTSRVHNMQHDRNECLTPQGVEDKCVLEDRFCVIGDQAMSKLNT